MEEKKLTDEQLYELCLEYEKQKQAQQEQVKHFENDKGVDWEFWQLMYTKSKDLK